MTIANAGVSEGATPFKNSKTRAPEWFAKAYLAAVAGGVLPVFVSSTLWMFPVGAMLAYVWYCYDAARSAGSVFEFADSVYYLGFTLSVGSLLAALDPFHLVAKPDPNQIFHLFGLGMLTTLIGVVARTTLQTWHRDAAETVEVVNQRIAAEADTYLTQLSTLSARVQLMVANTAESYADSVTPQLAKVQEAVQKTADQLGATAQHTQMLDGEIKRASQSIGAFADAYSNAAGVFEENRRKVDEAQRGVMIAFSETVSAAASGNRLLGDTVDQVAASALACRVSLDGFAQRVTTLSIDPTTAQASLHRMADSINEASDRSVAVLGDLAAGANSLALAVAEARKSGAALRAKSLTEGIEAVRAQLEGLSSDIKEHRAGVESHLGSVAQTAGETLAAARRLGTAMDEVVDAATTRLQRLQ
jgi:hypothetical protein